MRRCCSTCMAWSRHHKLLPPLPPIQLFNRFGSVCMYFCCVSPCDRTRTLFKEFVMVSLLFVYRMRCIRIYTYLHQSGTQLVALRFRCWDIPFLSHIYMLGKERKKQQQQDWHRLRQTGFLFVHRIQKSQITQTIHYLQ